MFTAGSRKFCRQSRNIGCPYLGSAAIVHPVSCARQYIDYSTASCSCGRAADCIMTGNAARTVRRPHGRSDIREILDPVSANGRLSCGKLRFQGFRAGTPAGGTALRRRTHAASDTKGITKNNEE